MAKEDVTFLEGKCLSYGMGVTYHPIIDILKSNFDIMEGDSDQKITEKISGNLKVLGADEASTLPYLLELLSVKESSINKMPMSPDAKKNKILEALKRITLKGSEIRPLIIAVEDLHWIDKSSEDAIKELLEGISGSRVFLLFTYRPEFVSSWHPKSYHRQVNLNRLSERQTLVMVDHLLGSEDIDIDLEQLLLEKAERIPLFLEEFIRSFIDLKLIEKRDKYYLVKEVLTRIVDIRTILGIRLMDMNYFHQAKEMISPVIEMAANMGRTRRIAQIHSILGSYHYCVKEDFPQAFDHHYRSLEIVKDLDDTNLLAMAHYWLGWPLAFRCDFKSALNHFNQALAIHVQDGNPIWVSIIMALTGHIAYHYWGRQESAFEYTLKAVVLADESGDVYSRLLVYSCHGVSCFSRGNMDGALEYLSTGLAVAEQTDQFYWRPGNHQFLGDIYYELGDYQESIGHYQEAIRHLERSGNLPSWKNMIELVLIRTGLAADQRPDFDPRFLAEYSTSNEICVYDGLVKRHIGEIMVYLGQLGEAENWLEQAVQTHQKNEMRFHLASDYAVRADICKRRGAPTAAGEYLTWAINIFKECGAVGWVEKYKKELVALS